jgi:hypothetical protein
MKLSEIMSDSKKLRSELEALIEHGRTVRHSRSDDIFVNAYVVRSHWRRRSHSRRLKLVKTG